MKEIYIDPQHTALVSDEDYEYLSKFKWKMLGKRPMVMISIHRMIIPEIPEGMVVDHINRNPLDNRRENLRVVSRSDNAFNTGMHPRNTSGYKGVHFDAHSKKWVASIQRAGRVYSSKHLKRKEAIHARNEMLNNLSIQPPE